MRDAKPLGTFLYSSLESLLVYFQVDAKAVRPFLKGTGLEPAVFDGKALVNLNFERYASVGGSYDGMCNECEFNVVAYPRRSKDDILDLSLWQYLMGQDETKLYGNYRINVPCDSPVAVKAGSTQFGENKFVASFAYQVPDDNSPSTTGWWLRCYATPEPPKNAKPSDATPYIFDMKANFSAMAPGVVPFSPLGAWANLEVAEGKSKKKRKYMVMSARNIFGVFQGFFSGSTNPGAAPAGGVAPLAPGTVQVTVGEARSPLTPQMKAVFKGDPPAVAALLFQSQPAAASTHTLLLDPIR